jgi:hypothetical protein
MDAAEVAGKRVQRNTNKEAVMAATLKVLKQKRGVNFSTLVVLITLSGAYVTITGESVTLTGAGIPNPGAQVVTGPSTAPLIPPRLSFSLGGYTATLTPTATPLVYTLQFWNGDTELASENYPAVISGGTLVVEIDFGTGSFDS